MFESLLFIKLRNCRIKRRKEFFTNYDLIKEEFELILGILEKNNSIEEYYENIMYT